MKKILFYFFISCILLSCKKGAGTFILKGEINDLSFDSKLSDVYVKLYKVPIGTTNLVIQDSIFLSSDGKYEFSFLREQIERYVIKVCKEGYFDIIEDVYFSDLTLDNENVRNLGTYSKSWIGITLINNNPDPLDQFTYIKQLGLEDCLECCPSTQQSFFGSLDTTIFCINNGNDPYSILYSVIGTSNTAVISQITPPFDTTYINVSY